MLRVAVVAPAVAHLAAGPRQEGVFTPHPMTPMTNRLCVVVGAALLLLSGALASTTFTKSLRRVARLDGPALAAAPRIATAGALRAGFLGVGYEQRLESDGANRDAVDVDASPLVWSVVAGELPLGLALVDGPDATAKIVGVPLAPGEYSFTVSLGAGNGTTDAREFTLSVLNASATGPGVAAAGLRSGMGSAAGATPLLPAPAEIGLPVRAAAAASRAPDEEIAPPATAAATAPTIVTHPVSRTANITDSVTFSVTTGGTPPSFQWQKGGVNITGAVNATLTLASVTPADAASYQVIVTNTAGTVTSNAATLTVTSLVPQPFTTTTIANDTFADGERSTQSLPGSLAWFTSGPGTSLTVGGAPGSEAMTLTATTGRHAVAHFPLQSLLVGDALTLSFDFALTSPTKNGVLRLGLFNRNGGSAFTADNIDPSVNYTGYVSYTNVAPTSANPQQLRERVASPAATLITSSQAYGNQLGLASGGTVAALADGQTYNARFTVLRTAENRVTITVSYTGGALAGHTFSRNDIDVVTAFDTLAICLYGSGSAVAASAIKIDNVAVVLTKPSVLDTFSDGERNTQAPAGSLAWFASHASTTLTVANQAMTLTAGSGGSGSSRHAVAHFAAQTVPVGDTLTASFDFVLTNPVADGVVRFGLFNSNGGALFSADNSNPNVTYPGYAVFTNIAPSAANPTSWRKRATSPAGTLITQTTAYGTALGGAGGPQQAFAAGTTYHAKLTFTRTATDAVSLTVEYTGGALSGNTLTRTDTAIVSTFDTIAACVYGSGGFVGADAITVDNVALVAAKTPTTPTIVTQPSVGTTYFGDTVALGVTASGVPAEFTYQWKLGGVDIAGATSPFLSFPNVKPASNGSYTVVVTGSSGSVTSNAAVLTVNNLSPIQTAVTITTQPTSQTVSTSANITFTAAATGNPAPTFQWRRNGVNLSGATGTSLSLTNVQPTDAADYTVLVNNSSGTVISNKATLVVNGAPVITAQPLTQSARSNSTLTLRVAAAGTAPLSYQWKKFGTAIAGATGFTHQILNASTADSADYTVVVTNASGSVTSVAATLTVSTPGTTYASAKVVNDGNGNLSYPADAAQNRVVDFSYAGYKGGGVPLPAVPVVKTISPIAGDNTAAIQAAIDEVGAMSVQANGYRGTLLLTAGLYRVDGTVLMNKSGVVLAGVGDGHDPATNTILQRPLSSSTASVLIAGGGFNDRFRSELANTRAEITTAFMQVGARSFDVDTPSLYTVGDQVVVYQPSTDAWLAAINYGGTADEPWVPGTKDLRYLRYVTGKSGNTITIDAPVFNHLDRNLSQSYLYKYDRTGIVTNVGLENFLVDIVTNGDLTEDHAKHCIEFVEAEDCWARKVTTQHFVLYGIVLGGDCSRTTVDSCRAIDPNSTIAGARRYNFATYQAQLVLFRNCYTSQGRHSFANSGGSVDAGVVFLDCVADNTLAASEPHAWWSTATLYDNVTFQHPGVTTAVQLYNAGDVSDHGWCAAHSVLWRVQAGGSGYDIIVQQPPTAQNYAIGSFGNNTGTGLYVQPAGYIELANQEPAVRSLYRAQLADRLGTAPDGATTTTILADSFNDGNRTGQSLPSSAAWFASAASTTLVIDGDGMKLVAGGTASRHAVAHFPAKALGIGDALTLDFDFWLTNPATDGVIRLGLFNSNGNSLFTADNTNPNVTYTGYAVLTNIAPTTANPTSFRRRNATTSTTLITQTGAYGSSFGAGGPQVSFASGTAYHATLKVTVIGVDSATLSVTYTGGALSGYTVTTDVAGIVSLYDTLALCVYGNSTDGSGADALKVDNVTLAHTSTP